MACDAHPAAPRDRSRGASYQPGLPGVAAALLKSRRHARKFETVSAPLFPRYFSSFSTSRATASGASTARSERTGSCMRRRARAGAVRARGATNGRAEADDVARFGTDAKPSGRSPSCWGRSRASMRGRSRAARHCGGLLFSRHELPNLSISSAPLTAPQQLGSFCGLRAASYNYELCAINIHAIKVGTNVEQGNLIPIFG